MVYMLRLHVDDDLYPKQVGCAALHYNRLYHRKE